MEGSNETLPAAIPAFREAPRDEAAETLGKLREMVRVEPRSESRLTMPGRFEAVNPNVSAFSGNYSDSSGPDGPNHSIDN